MAFGQNANVADVFESIFIAIREILEARSWVKAFERDGFSVYQTRVQKRKWRKLGIVAPVLVGSARPTIGQLQAVFPKRRKVPVASLWRSVDRCAAASGDVLGDCIPEGPLAIYGVTSSMISVSTAVLMTEASEPISTRTRSRIKFTGASSSTARPTP